MAGFLALGNDQYIGSYKLDEANGVENGVFVVLNHANKTAKLADATTGDGDVYFVANEIDTIDEQGIDDVKFVNKNGKFLRLHKPQKGEVLVTTMFTGTLNDGDKVAVGAAGKAVAIGTRTPATSFAVEKTVAYGQDVVKLLVL
ncbi:hypothetical protein [Bacillus infantis]|uniref:hypothetical protein n=1 Tax=Bacillus infantis TaxID=324767 RepID=UPI0020A10CEE|nr:hypothetical protein [Bacillus infantis]MCP1159436.1 hypothetical protein [Bacillus infantis]